MRSAVLGFVVPGCSEFADQVGLVGCIPLGIASYAGFIGVQVGMAAWALTSSVCLVEDLVCGATDAGQVFGVPGGRSSAFYADSGLVGEEVSLALTFLGGSIVSRIHS